MDKIRQAMSLASKKTDQVEEPVPIKHEPVAGKKIDYTQTRLLGGLKGRFRRRRVISAGVNGAIENAYKILRTQVLQLMKQNGWNSIGVVSANQNEGKTLTAINLSISIAQESQHTVLLVDFDLKSPSVHTYFEDTPEYGIGDYFFNDISLQKILFNPGVDGLVVLPGNRPFTNSSETLSSPKTISLVDELKSRYAQRVVIFDLPSLLSSDDVLAFSPYVDAVLMVIEDGKTGRDNLLQAMDYLRNTNVIGSVLNKSGSIVTLKN